jgi:anti-anti-sigma factor
MSVSARELDGGSCAVVSLAGQAGIDRAWFRELLELQTARAPDRMVVDLSRLSSMDWWAVLMLLWVARVVTRRGGTLVLASPQPAVAQLLNSAGARQIVRVYDSVWQASADQAVGSPAAC